MRQRRNKTATTTVLEGRRRKAPPKLPDRPVECDTCGRTWWKVEAAERVCGARDQEGNPCVGRFQKTEWHPMTIAFWDDVWASPMAKEYLDSDVHGLYVLAELVERYWREPNGPAAAEIRLQRQCFGLTPIDRRRLQWEVARVESTKRPRNRDPEPKTSSRRRITGDPRSVLRVV
jgi:hypothetical protein